MSVDDLLPSRQTLSRYAGHSREKFTRRDFMKWGAASAAALSIGSTTGMADNAVPVYSIPCDGPNCLRAHGAARNLPVGSAVVIQQIQRDAKFRDLLQNQASILVSDWQMKWNVLRPAPNQFFFADADWLVNYALSHGQLMRGHNLCWHQALPNWFAGYANRSNARHLLSQHITTVVSRYAGKIHSWDVVNEAIDVERGNANGLRDTPWLELAGSDYIDFAFRTARAADPHALLTYNDNNVEAENQGSKRDAVLNLVGGMKKRGVPIDAVGIQSHLSAKGEYGAEIVRFIRDLRALGLQVFITEMDVDDSGVQGTFAQRDALVAAIYFKFLDLVLPEPNVTALLTWEERDKDSWLENRICPDGSRPRPLPFDGNYQAKPAFLSMRNAIDRCPRKSA